MSYWDTSALLKLYVAELDSTSFVQLASQVSTKTSRLALFEIQTVLYRAEKENGISNGAAELIYERVERDVSAGQLIIVEFSRELEIAFRKVLAGCFRHTTPRFIKTLDAMHLAGALVAGETQFISTDVRLIAAAKVLGLQVLP